MWPFTRKQEEVPVERAGDDTRALKDELALLRDDLDRLDQAFTSFRQRVYAWRKGEKDPEAKQPTDKAAILAAHRLKQ